jgi:hypothetical protein
MQRYISGRISVFSLLRVCVCVYVSLCMKALIIISLNYCLTSPLSKIGTVTVSLMHVCVCVGGREAHRDEEGVQSRPPECYNAAEEQVCVCMCMYVCMEVCVADDVSDPCFPFVSPHLT